MCRFINETSGNAINPTPAIGGVGKLDDLSQMKTIAFKSEGETIILVGETHGHLGNTTYARDICGCEKTAPPVTDLAAELMNGQLILEANELITACHDISDGGLFVALAEMAMASGIGAKLREYEGDVPLHGFGFGEDQSRYLVTTDKPKLFLKKAESAGVKAVEIGMTGGKKLIHGNELNVEITALKQAHDSWFDEYMAG